MECDFLVQDEAWVERAKGILTDLYEARPLERIPFEFQAYEAKAHALYNGKGGVV